MVVRRLRLCVRKPCGPRTLELEREDIAEQPLFQTHLGCELANEPSHSSIFRAQFSAASVACCGVSRLVLSSCGPGVGSSACLGFLAIPCALGSSPTEVRCRPLCAHRRAPTLSPPMVVHLLLRSCRGREVLAGQRLPRPRAVHDVRHGDCLRTHFFGCHGAFGSFRCARLATSLSVHRTRDDRMLGWVGVRVWNSCNAAWHGAFPDHVTCVYGLRSALGAGRSP